MLRGAQNQRIGQLGHDSLSTYGIGRDQSQEVWGSLLRQLIHLGYLEQDVGNYSILKLTAAARPLLRGEEVLRLARPRVRVASAKKPSRKGAAEYQADPEVFEALRALRKSLAERDHVPPFVVFSDATLAEMASVLPTHESALLEINGVGRRKLERYGADFLDLIRSL